MVAVAVPPRLGLVGQVVLPDPGVQEGHPGLGVPQVQEGHPGLGVPRALEGHPGPGVPPCPQGHQEGLPARLVPLVVGHPALPVHHKPQGHRGTRGLGGLRAGPPLSPPPSPPRALIPVRFPRAPSHLVL